MNRVVLASLLFLVGCDFSQPGTPPAPVPPSTGAGWGDAAARYVESGLPETTDELMRVLDTAAVVDGVEFDSAKLWPEWRAENKPLTDAMRKEAAARLRGGK